MCHKRTGQDKPVVLGETFYSLSGQFCVGTSTVGEIVRETCQAIVVALKEFTKVPSDSNE